MKNLAKPLLSGTIALGLALGMSFCTNNTGDIPEAEYQNKIVGKWLGIVGNEKENMTLNNDSTFVCDVHPTGFIANTLSQGINERGSISGTWKINGDAIFLTITGEKNENLENTQTFSTIESFKENEIVLKSDKGEVSTFHRE